MVDDTSAPKAEAVEEPKPQDNPKPTKAEEEREPELKLVSGEELKPDEKPIEPVKVEEAEVVEEKPTEEKGFILRTIDTGDKVYLVKGGRRFWVMNPETLSKLGFKLGEEKNVSYSELAKYPEAEPLDLTRVGSPEPDQAVEESIKKDEEQKKEQAELGNKPYKIYR